MQCTRQLLDSNQNAQEQDLHRIAHSQAFDVCGFGTSRGSLCIAAISTVDMVHASQFEYPTGTLIKGLTNLQAR